MGLSNQGPQVMEVMVENQDVTEDGNQFETESEASNEEEVHGIISFFLC